MRVREPRPRRSTGKSGTLTQADAYAYAAAIDYDFATHIGQLPANDPYFEVSKPGLKGEAAAQDQRSWPMAEILYHELRHRLILIDRDISALNLRTVFSAAFKEYVVARNYLQGTAKRPIGAGGYATDAKGYRLPHSGQIRVLKNPAAAFSAPPDSAPVAQRYAANHFASTPGGVPARVADVRNLYDHLDAGLLHARGQHPQ